MARAKSTGSVRPKKRTSGNATRAVIAVPSSGTVRSLTECAYAEIRNRVMTLAFRPGEFLNESFICAAIGIGRTPVHEALHRLQIEGLVQIVPRKGVLIRTDSLNDVIALIETRMLVEPSGMALAAQRAKSHHLTTLQTILKQARRAIRDDDRASYMTLDLKFHDEIVSATDNAVLADVIRMLHQRASRIWNLQVWTSADLRVTQIEHEEIFAALKSGDADAASAAARAHLTSLRRRILQVV